MLVRSNANNITVHRHATLPAPFRGFATLLAAHLLTDASDTKSADQASRSCKGADRASLSRECRLARFTGGAVTRHGPLWSRKAACIRLLRHEVWLELELLSPLSAFSAPGCVAGGLVDGPSSSPSARAGGVHCTVVISAVSGIVGSCLALSLPGPSLSLSLSLPFYRQGYEQGVSPLPLSLSLSHKSVRHA